MLFSSRALRVHRRAVRFLLLFFRHAEFCLNTKGAVRSSFMVHARRGTRGMGGETLLFPRSAPCHFARICVPELALTRRVGQVSWGVEPKRRADEAQCQAHLMQGRFQTRGPCKVVSMARSPKKFFDFKQIAMMIVLCISRC